MYLLSSGNAITTQGQLMVLRNPVFLKAQRNPVFSKNLVSDLSKFLGNGAIVPFLILSLTCNGFLGKPFTIESWLGLTISSSLFPIPYSLFPKSIYFLVLFKVDVKPNLFQRPTNHWWRNCIAVKNVAIAPRHRQTMLVWETLQAGIFYIR